MPSNVYTIPEAEVIGKGSTRILPFTYNEIGTQLFSISSATATLYLKSDGSEKFTDKAGTVLTGNRKIEFTLSTSDTDTAGEYLLVGKATLSTGEDFFFEQTVLVVDPAARYTIP